MSRLSVRQYVALKAAADGALRWTRGGYIAGCEIIDGVTIASLARRRLVALFPYTNARPRITEEGTLVLARSGAVRAQLERAAAAEALCAERLPTLPPRVRAVIRDVVAETGVTPLAMLGSSRVREIVRARQEAMCRCRELVPQPSWPQVGHWFGHRDHTTVIHAWRKLRLGGFTKTQLLQRYGAHP